VLAQRRAIQWAAAQPPNLNPVRVKMKIGVSLPLTAASGDPGAIAREAENLGFESIWSVEHACVPSGYTTHYPRSADGKVPAMYAQLAETWVVLAIAASATKRIKLGTGILLLAQHNVIETARAAATLDMYSAGRLILGVGAGWFREEAEVMGVRFERRWKHLRESVEALRILWTQDEASYAGEVIKFPPLRVGPKPVQKPCPPIMLGAHDPRYALKRVARYADGWMPGGLSPEKAMECIPEIKRLAKGYGRDPECLQFSVALAMRGDEPGVDTLKRYESAGVSRIILMATAAASGDGVAAVRAIAPVVERAARL
jgi:probable F420-dependent oxidoreductase